MSLDDGLSKFVGGLYEAVLDPDAWGAAIAEVIRRSESRMLVATTVDLRRTDVVDIRFHGLEESAAETGAREYVDAMSVADPVFKWIQQHPAAGSCVSAAVLPPSDYRKHEFVKWCESRFGTGHWSVFYTPPVDDLSFVISFFAPRDVDRPGRSQLSLQALLFENVERAVRLAARPPNFTDDDSALIAIDRQGRVLSLSKRAEELLRDSDGLAISAGILTVTNRCDGRRLQRAIRAAIDPSPGELRGRGVRIGRGPGKADLLLVVSRFPPSLDHVPTPLAAALVRLIELEMRPEHLSEHSHLFDLSARETEIASALLHGHSMDSMAAFLGISRNTARNHVQSLFRKTATNRQSDLMRMLDRLARQ